jgi:hypothetical protein
VTEYSALRDLDLTFASKLVDMVATALKQLHVPSYVERATQSDQLRLLARKAY